MSTTYRPHTAANFRTMTTVALRDEYDAIRDRQYARRGTAVPKIERDAIAAIVSELRRRGD